ncbi:MAG: glycosyltransferase 87 family protein [Candidatus Micrarchaeaceae archaeon]
MTNPGVYGNATLAINNFGTIEAAGLYFEDFRAPLSSVLMLPFTPLSPEYALLCYVVLVYLLLAWASTYLADALGMNRLVTYAAFLSPYLLYFGFIVNGTEALSAAFLLFGLGLISKRSSFSGILFGLAALAKYPTMIFFPLLFLLRKPKKITYAFLLEALVVLPWLLFNYAVFGNPLASYIDAFNVALVTPFEPLYPGTMLSLFWYPALLCTIAILLFYMLRFRLKPRMREKIFIPKSMAGEIVIGFLVISIVEFMLVGWHYDVFSQSRFGYLSYFGVSLAAAYMLSRIGKVHRRVYGLDLGALQFVVAAICLAVLAYYAFAFHSSMKYYNYPLYNPNDAASVLNNAKGELYALGYGNCSIVSNAWVPMKYIGINAYMPQYYGIDESRYIVVSFKNVNVKPKISGYINESRPVFESKYFEILVPENMRC